MDLPKLPSREIVSERLPLILLPGAPNRNYCIREVAVNVIYTMLYVGSVNNNNLIAPRHVYRMTDEQANKINDKDRTDYYQGILGKKKIRVDGIRWYEDNTREQVRDETIRDGLVQIGAILVDATIPTTSSKPRYFLQKDFADLFNPDLEGNALENTIQKWQEKNLSAGTLARTQINLKGTQSTEHILVKFPNGETRYLEPGPSSFITKEVIEQFAVRFLEKPFVLWISESGNKVVHRDDRLASSLQLNIESGKELPDIILVDTGPPDPLIVFVEVVATDGAITKRRMEALYQLSDKPGYKRDRVLFVTAYLDRQSAGFKKTIAHVEWNSIIWFASEPGHIGILHEGMIKLHDLSEFLKNRN